jgi:hypothetical protein
MPPELALKTGDVLEFRWVHHSGWHRMGLQVKAADDTFSILTTDLPHCSRAIGYLRSGG